MNLLSLCLNILQIWKLKPQFFDMTNHKILTARFWVDLNLQEIGFYKKAVFTDNIAAFLWHFLQLGSIFHFKIALKAGQQKMLFPIKSLTEKCPIKDIYHFYGHTVFKVPFLWVFSPGVCLNLQFTLLFRVTQYACPKNSAKLLFPCSYSPSAPEYALVVSYQFRQPTFPCWFGASWERLDCSWHHH